MLSCLKMKHKADGLSTMTTTAFCTDFISLQGSGNSLYHDSPDFSGTCSTYSITLDFNLSNALFASSACGSRFDLSLSTALWAPSACGMTLDFSLSTTDFASSGGGSQCLLHPLPASYHKRSLANPSPTLFKSQMTILPSMPDVLKRDIAFSGSSSASGTRGRMVMMQFSCVVEGAFGSVGSLPNHLNLPFAAANKVSDFGSVAAGFTSSKNVTNSQTPPLSHAKSIGLQLNPPATSLVSDRNKTYITQRQMT